jgi:hypothetical protein
MRGLRVEENGDEEEQSDSSGYSQVKGRVEKRLKEWSVESGEK